MYLGSSADSPRLPLTAIVSSLALDAAPPQPERDDAVVDAPYALPALDDSKNAPSMDPPAMDLEAYSLS